MINREQVDYADMARQGPGNRADPFHLDFDKQFFQNDDEYEPVRVIQKAIYRETKRGCFNCLALTLGIIMSFVWGLLMGMTQFLLIWFLLPSWNLMKLLYTPGAAVTGALLNAIFGKCLKNLAAEGTTIKVTDRGEGRNGAPVIVSNVENQQSHGN